MIKVANFPKVKYSTDRLYCVAIGEFFMYLKLVAQKPLYIIRKYRRPNFIGSVPCKVIQLFCQPTFQNRTFQSAENGKCRTKFLVGQHKIGVHVF